MSAETNNHIFTTALRLFIDDYENGIYTPVTEADIQFYLMALCKKLMQENNMPLDIHANYAIPKHESLKSKKIDIVIGSAIAIEIKFEANYPGVSKPVVFPAAAAKDIDRLNDLKLAGIDYCHFIFLDEDGTHFRNFSKYTTHPLLWKALNRNNQPQSKLLHLSF